MPFLRKKKGVKSTTTDPIPSNDDTSAEKEKMKFGRKKKKSELAAHDDESNTILLTNNAPSSQQTITTASTSNTSSVGALFDPPSKTKALQQRQASHLRRVGSPAAATSVASAMNVQSQQTVTQSRQPSGTRPQHPTETTQPQTNTSTAQQQRKPQTDLFAPPAPMMTRSGWSILSNASTAMNSVQYLESLDELPGSPGVKGKVSCILLLLLINTWLRLQYYILQFQLHVYSKKQLAAIPSTQHPIRQSHPFLPLPSLRTHSYPPHSFTQMGSIHRTTLLGRRRTSIQIQNRFDAIALRETRITNHLQFGINDAFVARLCLVGKSLEGRISRCHVDTTAFVGFVF
jgi:hypothetical protein